MIAKGPNILNLHAYTQGEQQTSYNDNQYNDNYQQDNQNDRHYLNSKNIQQQFDNFLEEINKYDQILGTVARNIDQLNASEYITDFYPEFIINTTYQNDQEKKIINQNQPELMKIMSKLENQNKKLKQDIKGWTFQFAKNSQITENLINQNQILRKAIKVKNKQIVKLIQNISNTQNQQIQQLKQNLEILREQNGVLLLHLTKINEEMNQQKEDITRLSNVLTETKTNFLQIQKQSQSIQDQEDHLSKTVALLEQSLNEMLRRKKKLQKQKNRLIQLRQDYTLDSTIIQSEVVAYQQDKKVIQKQLKSKFQGHQAEKVQLIELIEDHTQKIQKNKQKQRFLESQINRNEHRLQQFNKINKDLKSKYETNVQISQKLKKQFVKIIDSESTLSSEIDGLVLEIQSLKEELKSHEQRQKQIQIKNKLQIKKLEEENSKKLTEYRSKQIKQIKELNKKIFQDKLELSVKEKETTEWQKKINIKKQDIHQLKNQIKQIKSNKSKLNQMKIKIREKKNNQ